MLFRGGVVVEVFHVEVIHVTTHMLPRPLPYGLGKNSNLYHSSKNTTTCLHINRSNSKHAIATTHLETHLHTIWDIHILIFFSFLSSSRSCLLLNAAAHHHAHHHVCLLEQHVQCAHITPKSCPNLNTLPLCNLSPTVYSYPPTVTRNAH